MSETPSDYDLLRGITRRDVAALKSLFERYAPLMLAIARRILRDEHEAEDLVNEVFWALWDKPERFVPERGAPRTYLLMVTRSRAIDRLRSLGAGTSGKTRVGAVPETAAHHDNPAGQAEANETGRLVRQLLSELPEDQREVVSLSFFEGLTHTQIAEQTQQPLGTIKGRIRKGLIRLRDDMRKWRGGDSS